MISYLINKLCQYVIVFCIILIVIFTLPRTLPGDPADYFVGTTSMEVGELGMHLREQLISRFGLNKSISEQFFLFLLNTFQGYFGVSWKYYPRDVLAVIMERLPWTLFIVVVSRIVSLIFGYFAGVVAAWKRGGKMDVLLQLLGMTSMSLPAFWMGMILIMAFAFYIPLFPFGGSLTPGVTHQGVWEFMCDVAYHATLPIITLSIVNFFVNAIVLRNNIVEVLGEDFIITAEAKGLNEKTIIFKHAARSALLPFITGNIISFGLMVSGALFVETAFSYPGMGLLLTEAIYARDFPMVQGILIITTIIILASNFIADLVYMWLDPRVRLIK